MAQQNIVLVSELSDRYTTAQDDINANFTELYASTSGSVPGTRTIEINGVTQDLSANRTFTVTDANLSTSDVVTNNASTTKHGFLKKLSNIATEYMDGTGNWSTPPGGVSAFTGLSDVPASYVGNALKLVRVNAAPNALEFVTADKNLVGLGNVDNTADSAKVVAEAAKLSTARDINGIAFDGSADIITDPLINIITDLGGSIKSVHPFGFAGNSGSGLADNRLFLQAVYLPKDATITGVAWIQVTQGNYTGDNYCGVGLYTYSGGTLTLVASSTHDADIWKAASGSLGTKAFSSTYPATAGTYFIGALYCQSAQTTAPSLHCVSSAIQSGQMTLNLTNSAKLSGLLNAQTALPATQASSGLSVDTAPKLFMLY